MSEELKQACTDILDQLMKKHGFLQLECKEFGSYDEQDAMDAISDLLSMIKDSEEIGMASYEIDFGK